MAQYDLHLIQNTHASGIEFSEKQVNIAKGGLLSANASQTPTILAAGTDGYILARDDAEATGLKWIAQSGGHTQNTDVGTTSPVFELDSDGNKIELTAESASKFEVKVDGGATYVELQAKDYTFAKVTVVAAPVAGSDLVNKTYADGVLAANEAMIFKGTIGAGGTVEIAAFNALTSYNSGWTYRVIEAGTIRGVVCEIGDLITAIETRTGSGNLDADWTVMQTNLDGAVIGPESSSSDALACFSGTSGKIIYADGRGAPGSMAFENSGSFIAKTNYDTDCILFSKLSGVPQTVTITQKYLLGMKSGAGEYLAPLTEADIMDIICVTAPATKTSTGTAGQIAFDSNFIYRCISTNVWTRAAMATNW